MLGTVWAAFGSLLDRRGASCCRLGCVLEAGGRLGGSWRWLGRLGSVVGSTYRRLLGDTLGRLGSISGRLEGPLISFRDSRGIFEAF